MRTKIGLMVSAVEETGHRYSDLFEEAPVPYHEVGLDGTILRVNQAECTLLGYEKHEMVGKAVWAFVAPHLQETSREAVHRKLTSSEALRPFEREYRCRDNTPVIAQIHENRIYDEDDRVIGIRTAMLDITERKKQDEALARRTEELTRSNAELEQFAYVASHDLQEPLRMISSYTQLLAKRYRGRLDSDADEFIAYAVDGATRMQGLINDLLAYSRVGRRDGEFRPVSAAKLVTVAMENLRASLSESGARVQCDPLPDIMADPVLLTQVFQNLIGNALKFRKGTPEIHIEAIDHPTEWEFVVKDNGIGIDSKHADRIFQVFQRLHTKEQYAGTGIGLAICKKAVERHGGKLWVISQLGHGAAFHLTIGKNLISNYLKAR